MLDGEPDPAELFLDLVAGVAAMVPDRLVDRSVQTGKRRHDEHDAAARPDEAPHARERGPVVRDVLEDIRADDRVEGRCRHAVAVQMSEVEPADLDLRIVRVDAAQELDVLAIDVGRDQALARREVLGHHPGAGADLENALADVRADQVPEEQGVATERLDPRQRHEPFVRPTGIAEEGEAEDREQRRHAVLPA